jgi:hypothetical protein
VGLVYDARGLAEVTIARPGVAKVLQDLLGMPLRAAWYTSLIESSNM